MTVSKLLHLSPAASQSVNSLKDVIRSQEIRPPIWHLNSWTRCLSSRCCIHRQREQDPESDPSSAVLKALAPHRTDIPSLIYTITCAHCAYGPSVIQYTSVTEVIDYFPSSIDWKYRLQNRGGLSALGNLNYCIFHPLLKIVVFSPL